GSKRDWSSDVCSSDLVIYHTCPAAAVGAKIELSWNGAVWTGKTSVAHDPPLVGAADDRVPRAGESYVKDFKPLSLGVAEVKKGQIGRASCRERGEVAT